MLRVVEGPLKGSAFELTRGGVYHIGRGAHSGVQIPDKLISRRHGTLEVTPGEAVIVFTDSSANGTILQSKRSGVPPKTIYRASVILRSGDCLLMGATCLRVEVFDEVDSRDDASVTSYKSHRSNRSKTAHWEAESKTASDVV